MLLEVKCKCKKIFTNTQTIVTYLQKFNEILSTYIYDLDLVCMSDKSFTLASDSGHIDNCSNYKYLSLYNLTASLHLFCLLVIGIQKGQ